MSISTRYRQLLQEVEQQADQLHASLPASAEKALRAIDAARDELSPIAETVGDIPQFQLENRLSPVLLKAHGKLDRGRVLLDDAGLAREGERVWELEQLIYRLLNDL